MESAQSLFRVLVVGEMLNKHVLARLSTKLWAPISGPLDASDLPAFSIPGTEFRRDRRPCRFGHTGLAIGSGRQPSSGLSSETSSISQA